MSARTLRRDVVEHALARLGTATTTDLQTEVEGLIEADGIKVGKITRQGMLDALHSLSSMGRAVATAVNDQTGEWVWKATRQTLRPLAREDDDEPEARTEPPAPAEPAPYAGRSRDELVALLVAQDGMLEEVADFFTAVRKRANGCREALDKLGLQ